MTNRYTFIMPGGLGTGDGPMQGYILLKKSQGAWNARDDCAG